MAKETSSANASLPLCEVLEAEFVALHGELPQHYPRSAEPSVRLKAIWAAIHGLPEKRSALCFSGGGIRSATFGLGILQGLASCGLLGKFHYLSTVSGGGYIGAWLTGWINRADGGLTSVVAQLAQPRDNTRPNPEPVEIQNLRSYSNYLNPRLGLLSADTWTLFHLHSQSAFDFAGHDSVARSGVNGPVVLRSGPYEKSNSLHAGPSLDRCGRCSDGHCLHGN